MAEPNLWALDEFVKPRAVEQTILTKMRHVLSYANFLEENELDWRQFPMRVDERALIKFRGCLLRKVEMGELAITTATARMSAVILFYRFAQSKNLVSTQVPMWEERRVVVRYVDSVGFGRSMARASTDLHIPMRRRVGNSLEDGLYPLSATDVRALFAYLKSNQTTELALMLLIGLYTGARIGTITTLGKRNLRAARPDPQLKDIHLIRIGPGTSVKTKFDVSGDLMVPTELLLRLVAYSESTERLKREARADDKDKNILFLTRRAKRYSVNTVDRLVEKMRAEAIRQGLQFMDSFRFHQTRATFGTQLMRMLLGVMSATNALDFVRSAMLHKSEATTMRYIKFIENSKAKQELSSEYSRLFTGVEEKWGGREP
ncbi:site-specific integrase [Acidithiobacillus sp. MC2.1]|uniref:site-specific integrase n=1 Tax=Acidithiobacillus sp. MC2.2 TaxID=2801579 RepID=UPI0019D08A80|nr:site-specific integrase [Acidithiobacillus sp. MC2.2]MBN6746227.1 site-specific integrase [Acidithiobacillus sp. MC2.2]